MTLLEKIDIVLKKYNNGEDNEYSLIMKDNIKDRYFKTDTNQTEVFVGLEKGMNIYELIGICILNNNPELFKQD